MKTRLFLIPLIPIAILFFLLYRIFEEPDDISNVPHSLVVEFKRFTEPSHSTKKLGYQEKDYHHLLDIDFRFKTLSLVCGKHQPFLLILVHSAVGNFEKRRAIRETWGRGSNEAKVVFLLGSSVDSEMIERIRQESNSFSDLVIGSFLDTYRNLTYKHVMGLKYALYHCSSAVYVLKTDDDVFVNTPFFVEHIKSTISPYGAEKLLMCNVWHGASVARSHRSRYRFSFKEFPYKRFPTYCSGWVVLYSPDVVFDLYTQAQQSQYFWVDDVFITGILAEKSNIPHFNLRNIVISKGKMDEIADGRCDATNGKILLGRPNIESDLVRKLWACAVLSDRQINS
ncbi:beta-1,3-galactosyltransferase 5-like [Coccinella septempunctata]|uniref:beta-1,3-galactosyltransferase 5-like n=1 Tax=Coccinella septempunctata TaxID=41139 RepID=UPI001D08417E|nr:beta-1,3-galactosyltransferase 5-like [Coccinella septempunctata]XP_044767000.1 beta-1,3-galactosyltransferase 5-like [Coccinella septempunctata]XP_044767001.1 beta-1,3-galactosyltransferase 5-like [Coccinella septempunctata]XP_044767002.1 beta-1,3-galactosyltransferase 5-like [Coccinella septempunctata]